MIGNVYPPSLGWINKIFCGSEQCWPVEDEDNVLHIIIKDNPVDQNVLETHRYTNADLWRFEYDDIYYYMPGRYYGLMYFGPDIVHSDMPYRIQVGFYQVVESDTGMRTFWLTDRNIYYHSETGEKTLDDYSDIIIYRD